MPARRFTRKATSGVRLAASPAGMLRQKSFEKVYTLTDIKEQKGSKIAIVDMNAVPSSKRADNMQEDEAKAAFSQIFR